MADPNVGDTRWRTALVATIEALRPTEGDDAPAAARRLLASAMGAEWLDLVKDPGRTLSMADADRLAAHVARRLTGEPVARIMGTRGFYGRDFEITRATLDPRPESETLIDAALAHVSNRWMRGAGLDILDIGTGSGCLLVSLLAELPEARGVGVDPSADALAVASRNAARLGVGDRAQWHEGRFEVLARELGRRFPLIVSNPPYIARHEIASLDRDVRDFDPHLALDGGDDGLFVYRAIAAALADVAAAGLLLLEIGETQSDDVIDIFMTSPLRARLGKAVTLVDLAAKPRCVAFEIRD